MLQFIEYPNALPAKAKAELDQLEWSLEAVDIVKETRLVKSSFWVNG